MGEVIDLIPLIEDYIIENIENKLDLLKKNPSAISRIVKLDKARLDMISKYLTKKEILLKKGYPRTPAELPCIAIMLSTEDETEEGLGDMGYSGDDQSFLTVGLPCKYGTVGYEIQLTKPNVQKVHNIRHNDTGMTIEQYDVDYAKSKIIIHDEGFVEEGDIFTIEFSYTSGAQETVRTMFEAEYRIEVWTENGDLTVDLYHLVKWAMLSGRDFLIDEKDIYRQKLSGGDFEPVRSFEPAFVYRRALTFWCQFSVDPIKDILDDDLHVVTEVHVNQEYYNREDS
ncbi:hypothetical protein SHANETTE_99 [Bacillus phage Shanette]|uniref:Uncharacterized protein n=1 Tax=Bacillus phage Shanette TaxID=1296656 RepID=S5M931_9CAUD|nr:hypothetical protein AVV46_gp198 [Bacillus phage Shanette]AGR46993.1 hypothetical protein SHANETTE_99 [Bacillus phage Shanette]